MKQKRFLILFLLAIVLVWPFSNVQAVSYFGYEQYGGTWHDAEKTLSNTEDDDLCWAAAASNILDWAGWDAGFSDHDAMFGHFQDHWLDKGGRSSTGWKWWFDGIDTTMVDVTGGGGFYTTYNFNDYYIGETDNSVAMPRIAEFLQDGYGVAIGIRGGGAHAITAWGYEYDDQTDAITGIYVTDSDDDKDTDTPPDVLAYYDVYKSSGNWYLDDFTGLTDWYIDDVWALDRGPDFQPVPEPGTLLLLGSGLIGLACFGRKKFIK